ncbi:hypothetical protein ACWCYZ_42165 [Streptomyces virginiae]
MAPCTAAVRTPQQDDRALWRVALNVREDRMTHFTHGTTSLLPDSGAALRLSRRRTAAVAGPDNPEVSPL